MRRTVGPPHRRGRQAHAPTLLVGAGEQVLRSILRSGLRSPYRVAGLLDDDPLTHQTSISLAVERYKREDITLGRAAEIAGVTSEEMKRVLADRGVEIRRGFLSPAERDAEARTMGPEP